MRGYGVASMVGAVVMLSATSSWAVEYNFANFPAGTTGSNVANMPPFPGLFLLNQTTYTGADSVYDNNGNKENLSYKSHTVTDTMRFLISYPLVLPFGGHLYTQMTLPFVNIHNVIAGYKTSASGLANPAFSPAIVAWRTKFDVNFITGIDIVTKYGSYGQGGSGVSTGYWTYCPNFGVRWDNPNGFDIGFLTRFLVNEKDAHTGYRSGDLVQNDFVAGWNVSKHLKFGAVGSYMVQYSNDTEADGVKPLGGNKLMLFQVGPSLTYDGSIFGVHINANLNWQVGALARNTAKASSIWFNIAFPLFAPAPHFPHLTPA